MRTAPVAVKNFLASATECIRADLLTLTLINGTVYRWTTFATDLTVGGNTFRGAGANGPLVDRSSITQRSMLSVDTVDVTLISGSFNVGGKSLQLLAVQGWFDGARLQIDHLVMPTPGDVSLGAVPSWFEGRVASVDPAGPAVVLRVKSELELLNFTLPQFKLQTACGHAVYDTNCGLSRAAFTLTGTVSAAASTTSFTTATAGLTAKAAGYFALGVVTFTGGVLAGQKRAVQVWSGSVFTMALPFTAKPGVGDAFSVYPGCDRKRATCLTRFNNLVAFRGFSKIPGTGSGK